MRGSAGIYMDNCKRLVKEFKEDDRRLVSDEEKFSIFAREIKNKWKDAKTIDKLKSKLNDIVTDALSQYERVVLFRRAVGDVHQKLEREKNHAKSLHGLAKKAKLAFLGEIENLKQLDADGGIVCEMRLALTDAKESKKDEQAALKEKLEEILDKGNERYDVLSLKDKQLKQLKIIETKVPKKIENTMMFNQGKHTALCYLRSIENGLIANENCGKLPRPDKTNGTYTFKVDVWGNKRDLTVTKDEIKDLKVWYEANWKRYNTVTGKDKTLKLPGSGQVTPDKNNHKYDGFAAYGLQEKSFSELDWAINLAQAKLAMWRDAQQMLPNGTQAAAPGQLRAENKNIGWTKVHDGNGNKNYENYLKKRLITQMGLDTEVAEFFGLVQDQNLAINHSLGKENQLSQETDELSKEDLFARWNEAREWKANNSQGVLTLNEANGHFVAIRDFYYQNDDDFGFIVRDSSGEKAEEKKINVRGFSLTPPHRHPGKCHALNVHCFKPRP